jgi:spore maturation protein CgeB
VLRSSESMDFVFIGLAITSSWGNGHATTYRSLIKGLSRLGHRVLFLEQDQPWYADNRDAPRLPYCQTELYTNLQDLRARFASEVRNADAVVVGSYVSNGIQVADWVIDEARGVRAFYDIDTPVTLGCLRTDSCEYLGSDQVSQFDLMLSFTGGPTLQKLESLYGARRALPLYCSVDSDAYHPQNLRRDIELGYMGTYSADRQPALELFLNEPARSFPTRKFMVVGPQYPQDIEWPGNVRRRDHLAPQEHAAFYGAQRFTLNLTRADMREAGHSPSVRIFEAAACGTPIVSDAWVGIEEFLAPGEEILIARSSEDVVSYLQDTSAAEIESLSRRARERILDAHTSDCRARELIEYVHGSSRTLPQSRSAQLLRAEL